MNEVAGYDVIGDIHGHADRLESLLTRLGYVERNGAWSHPERCAVFVGDFVDRGPQNIRCCRTAMGMMAAGAAKAVMGNHEFNHIALATPDSNAPGSWLRPHSEKNLNQAKATLAEFERSPAERDLILDWMRRLPLWLDLEGLRVVHASWDTAAQKRLAPYLSSGNTLNAEGFAKAARKGNEIHAARESLINGPECPLPAGVVWQDKDGHPRDEGRLKWWSLGNVAPELRDAFILPPAVRERLPSMPFTGALPAPDSDLRPVIFGHYWMDEPLTVLGPRHACVDASVARGGRLAAYRFSGESTLSDDNFVYA